MYKNEAEVIAINFDRNAECFSQRNVSCDHDDRRSFMI